jgi:hypothetical protein
VIKKYQDQIAKTGQYCGIPGVCATPDHCPTDSTILTAWTKVPFHPGTEELKSGTDRKDLQLTDNDFLGSSATLKRV